MLAEETKRCSATSHETRTAEGADTMTLPIDTVVLGDCLAVMGGLPDESVDVVLTDPPYSSGTRREAAKGLRKSMTRATEDAEWFGSDSLTTNGLAMLTRLCALEWKRVLKPGGHMFVFIDWRMMPTVAAAIESADVRHVGVLVWDKTYFGMGRCFRNQHEFIVHCTNGPGAPPQRRNVGNVLSVPPIRQGLHPTEKPVALLRQLISVACPPDGIVLDPFIGSGSTAIAALEEGCHYVGIERESEYLAIARRRIDQFRFRPRPLREPETFSQGTLLEQRP